LGQSVVIEVSKNASMELSPELMNELNSDDIMREFVRDECVGKKSILCNFTRLGDRGEVFLSK
jgi:hypothetical protein